MSKGFEDFIKKNKNEFDDQEPRADLWPDIEKKLQLPSEKIPVKKSFSLGFVLSIAALIMAVMSIGFIFYLQKQHQQPINLANINPEYARQQIHYASVVESKRIELKAVTKADPDLYREFDLEYIKMDSTYKKLNKELIGSPNQERVLRAMIRNLQIQTELLNQQLAVIEQYNQTKKQEYHGTKSI